MGKPKCPINKARRRLTEVKRLPLWFQRLLELQSVKPTSVLVSNLELTALGHTVGSDAVDVNTRSEF